MGITALYLRKSNEDESGTVSESIENQALFLKEYCVQNGFPEIKCYIDDGYSGTNFERPAFLELLRDIEDGKVSLVITKDYSRLGRNYIQAGYFCEQYFPEKKVRYIAVNDGIDTAVPGANNDMAPFRAVFNEMYARDISLKVRTALTAKKKDGQFIGAFAPYGYKKAPDNKNRLMPDEEHAPIVRRIYAMALRGQNPVSIARDLSAAGIPPPVQKKLPESRCACWNETTVRNILTNETYIGNLTQNRCRKLSHKSAKKLILPREEWITVLNTHPPLISPEDFQLVQKILTPRKRSASGKNPSLLSGLCFCMDCGAPMVYHQSGKYRYLVCSAWKKRSSAQPCTSHSIREDTLVQLLRTLFMEESKELSPELLFLAAEKSPLSAEEQLAKRIQREKTRQFQAYRDKTDGLLSASEYARFSGEIRNTLEILEKQRSFLCEDIAAKEAPSNAAENLLSFATLDRTALDLLLIRLEVGKNQVKIFLNFTQKKPSSP